MAYEKIKVELDEKVARIKLANPPLNIVDMKMMDEMITSLKEIENKKTMITVISSEGKHFSAGAEIKEHFPDKAPQMIGKFTELIKTILESSKITVALVKGYALGGGFEIPLVCDMVIASSNAKLGNPEILLAHYPPISLSVLPHIIPSKLAFEFIVTGETFDAEDAKEMGIVNHVFPEDQFEEMAGEFVNKLLEKSPIALLLTKKAFRKSLALSFDEKSRIVNEIYLNKLIKTEDAVEGLNAFLEKRRPKWKGK